MAMPLFSLSGFESIKVFARDAPNEYVCFDTYSQERIPCPQHTPLGDVLLFMIIGLFGSIFMSSLIFGLWVEFLTIRERVHSCIRFRRNYQSNYEPLPAYQDLEKNSVVQMEELESTGRVSSQAGVGTV